MDEKNELIERRSFKVAEMRVEGGGEGEGQRIEGYAAVYNQQSEMMWNFREVIEPGFFEGVLYGDTRSVWNHNTDLVLGRTKNGTLELQDDERGLRVKIDPPDTQAGRDAMTSIRRGDVDQMSFAFQVKTDGDRWVELDDGTYIRYLKRGGCKELYEVSPVTFPAYPQTTVGVRSMVETLQGQRAEQPEGQRSEESKKAEQRRRHRSRDLQTF